MSPNSTQTENNRSQYAFNLTLAAVAGQVGCLTIFVVLVALLAGLWLDNTLQSRPIFTIILMIASVPVTLIAMFVVVRKATANIKLNSKQNPAQTEEEATSGTNS